MSDLVSLEHPSGSKAQVRLYGATVVSWQVAGREQLFVSKQAILDGTKPIRGGIPVVFPQFGPGALPQHGFARNQVWKLTKTQLASESAPSIAEFNLESTELSSAQWGADKRFELTYTVELGAETLTTNFRVKNVGEQSFDFTALLHTYFSLRDILQADVLGLKGLTFFDKLKPAGENEMVEDRDRVFVDRETDRIYKGIGDKLEVHDGQGRGIILHNRGFPDAVVWNPWITKSKALTDFGDEEYKNMICVELGSVLSPVTLKSGEIWEAGQVLETAFVPVACDFQPRIPQP